MRIPLAEVVRFKEKQWFVEELEGSREGDANAMLRLAKVWCVWRFAREGDASAMLRLAKVYPGGVAIRFIR